MTGHLAIRGSLYVTPGRNVRRFVSIGLALAWLLVTHAACRAEPAATASIASGDLVEVVGVNRGHELVVQKGGERATVRLVGIYAFPISSMEREEIEVYAHAARRFVDRELRGREVTLVLEREALDPRGRYLGFIEEEGRDFNRRLIETSHADFVDQVRVEHDITKYFNRPNAKVLHPRISGKKLAAVMQTPGWAETAGDGADVSSLQSTLNQLGFDSGPVDGAFGPKTRTAVESFQRAHGLVVDGIAGPQTWGALNAALAANG